MAVLILVAILWLVSGVLKRWTAGPLLAPRLPGEADATGAIELKHPAALDR